MLAPPPTYQNCTLTNSKFVVFVIDDDPGVLQALCRLLQTAGYETRAYSSPQKFLDEHDASVPGCVVLDLAMPDLNGLEVQQVLMRQGIDRPIIFVTGRATIPESVLAMRAGALDFLSKPIDQSELMRAVRSAEERDRTRRHTQAKLQEVAKLIARLSRRQREVLSLVVAGLQNQTIATKLGRAKQTVKLHRGRMMKKMGVRSVAELVRLTACCLEAPVKADSARPDHQFASERKAASPNQTISRWSSVQFAHDRSAC